MPDTINPAHITQPLHEWKDGSREAFDCRLLASRRLSREWRHDRLQIAAVVNETYLRLFDQRAKVADDFGTGLRSMISGLLLRTGLG